MKPSGGLLIIILGMLVLYIALSDKYRCVSDFLVCMVGGVDTGANPAPNTTPKEVPKTGMSSPLRIPGIPNIPAFTPPFLPTR